MVKPGRKCKAIAYHEAGHAVAACLEGVPFRQVTIRPNAVFGGRVVLDRTKPPQDVCPWNPDWDVKAARQYWAARICGALAGPLAETLYTHCWQQQPVSDERTDEHKAWIIADYFDPPAKADRWVNQLRFQTLELLRNPDVWAAVDAVARELIEHKTLERADVAALVQHCGCHKTTLGSMAS